MSFRVGIWVVLVLLHFCETFRQVCSLLYEMGTSFCWQTEKKKTISNHVIEFCGLFLGMLPTLIGYEWQRWMMDSHQELKLKSRLAGKMVCQNHILFNKCGNILILLCSDCWHTRTKGLHIVFCYYETIIATYLCLMVSKDPHKLSLAPNGTFVLIAIENLTMGKKPCDQWMGKIKDHYCGRSTRRWREDIGRR